jgi:hypothetical protein
MSAQLRFDKEQGRWIRPRAERRRMARALRKHGPERNSTIFRLVHSNDAGLIKRYDPRGNLRTNAGLDWQASVMADFQSLAGTATATTATTLSVAGLTASKWINHVLVALVDVNTIRYGTILSNTTGAFTIDQWYDPTSSTGASGSTPSATSKFVVLPGGMPILWLALSTTVQSGAVGDTTLAGEITDSGLLRSVPTSFTHTAAATSWSLAKTYTATGTKTVNSEANFNAQNGGAMPFESAEPNAPTLVSGDTLAQTITCNY